MTKARDLANASTALSAVDATELGYLDGVTSAVQTQLNAKQPTVANVSDTEIGYLDGVTSAIQTQLDAKIAKSLTTTTGDIIYASGANTPARLGIGSTDQVLKVSGGVPVWATPASGSTFVGAAVHKNDGTAVADSTWTVMTFTQELYDTDSIHSTSTNTSRLTIPTGKSGKWFVNFVATYQGYSSNHNVQTAIYKNGSQLKLNRNGQQINDGERDLGVPAVLDLVAGDYIEFFVWQNSGISRTFYVTNSQGRAEIVYLGA